MNVKRFLAILFTVIVAAVWTLWLPVSVSGTNTPGVSGDPGWKEQILKERAEKDHEFKTSRTSPMAGADRLTIKAGQGQVFITENDNHIVVTSQDSPGVLFGLKEQNGQWYRIKRAEGISWVSGEKPVSLEEALPAQVQMDAGRYFFNLYISKTDATLIVFDSKRPQLLEFAHLLYYEPNPEFVVKATFTRSKTIETTKITTSRKLEKQFFRYGTVEFELKGKKCKLTALKLDTGTGSEGGELFIPFTDSTTGSETYDIGRFLDVPEPKDSVLIIDFNRCYNPLCNYSPAYNCPIPPLENFLDIAVHAGEKTYPH